MQGKNSGRLPHALLLTGPEGLGKHHFALQQRDLINGAPRDIAKGLGGIEYLGQQLPAEALNGEEVS